MAALQVLVVTGVKSRMKRLNKIVDHGTKEWNCRAGEKKKNLPRKFHFGGHSFLLLFTIGIRWLCRDSSKRRRDRPVVSDLIIAGLFRVGLGSIVELCGAWTMCTVGRVSDK